ncbi:hypothetical protein ACNAW0_29465 [Micromonospora sp. SL1-18]|uniref:hypothetical protein n=1 Tax=Micromonospora sp. SL1-18 TaxID=3399128 RepID=UPI003A4D4CDE
MKPRAQSGPGRLAPAVAILGLAVTILGNPAPGAAAPPAGDGHAAPSPASAPGTEDGNVTFRVVPRTPAPSPSTPSPSPSGHLPITGGQLSPNLRWLVLAGGILMFAGLTMVATRRHRSS